MSRQEKIIDISLRLSYLAQYLPHVEVCADIGTDHAQLLIYLLQTGKIRRGIGVEVVEGPYQNAVKNIKKYNLEDRIEIRKGDGFAPLSSGEIDAAIIAGMGGSNICKILQASLEIVCSLEWLLLQPNNHPGILRRCLQEIGWKIARETLVKERDIIYPVILAQPGRMDALTELEAEYGPIILKENPVLLRELVERDILALNRILEQLSFSTQEESIRRRQQVGREYTKLKELLKCL